MTALADKSILAADIPRTKAQSSMPLSASDPSISIRSPEAVHRGPSNGLGREEDQAPDDVSSQANSTVGLQPVSASNDTGRL